MYIWNQSFQYRSLKVVSNQYYKLKIDIYKKVLILIFILQKFQYLFNSLAFISKCHNQVLICIFKIKKIDMIKKKMRQIYLTTLFDFGSNVKTKVSNKY